jgi:hypothetical protein
VPHDPSGDASEPMSAEDAAWQAIVDNYGDRPHLEEDPAQTGSGDPEGLAEEVPGSPRDLVAPTLPGDGRPETGPEVGRPAPDPEEHFVPPPPPPIPRAEPARLLAWIGLFGVPTFVLVALVTRLPIASWLGLLLMVWFVGGFVFLVASMRSDPRDENDDGAVL